MVGQAKSNWHLQLFSALWAYWTTVKTSIGFAPIECEISSLKLVVELLPNTNVEEECFLYLGKLNETRRDGTLANEVHKKQIKSQYNRSI